MEPESSSESLESLEDEDIEYTCLHLLLQIHALKNPTDTRDAAEIFNEIFNVKGLSLFSGEGGSKGQKLEDIAELLDRDKPEMLIDEVHKCTDKDVAKSRSTYFQYLQERKSAYFNKQNPPTKLDDNVLNMFLNFQICLVEVEKLQVSYIRTDSSKSPLEGNHLFTLLDPYLKHDQFTRMGKESEWTHQIPITCIVLNACLNHSNLIFRTNEPFKRSDEFLYRALNTCNIETLSYKKRIQGDTHVITSLCGLESCFHVCLVMEHQRGSCATVWDYENLPKIILLMRTCLKTSITLGNKNGFKFNNLNMLGILSSRDHVFLLNMKTKFIPTNNTSNDGTEFFSVQYDLSIETFSSTHYESRYNFTKTLTGHLALFKEVEGEKKSFHIVTSPFLSKINITSECVVDLIDFDKCLHEDNNLSRCSLSILKNKFSEHRYTSSTAIDSSKTFSEVTKNCKIVLLSEVMNNPDLDVSKTNTFIVIAKVALEILIGFYFTKKQVIDELEDDEDKPCYKSNQHDTIPKADNKPNQDDTKNKRKNQNDSENPRKKTKSIFQENLIVNYTSNLKSITEKYNINSKKARKITTNDKIGLYFEIENQFLKIIHYFDHSSENVKGMNIVKTIEHDNISKIIGYEKQTLNISQMRELFVEEFTNINGTDFTVFITLSEWVADPITFIGNIQNHTVKSKLLCFVKILLDIIDAINTLHENDIVHCDISLLNIGFIWFSQFSKTKHAKEKLKVSEYIHIPRFDLVLLDLNHCKVEGQEQATPNMFRNDPLLDLDNIFFPFYTIPYCPTIDSLQFTKEHDIYSCALVLAQIFLMLFDNVSLDSMSVWMKDGTMKDKCIEKLTTKEKSSFGDHSPKVLTIIKLLKSTIENEGRTDLCNFDKTFQLLDEIIIEPLSL